MGLCPCDMSGTPSERELRRQMRNRVAVNFSRRRKATKILPRFQKDCQRQAAGIAAGGCTDEGVFGLTDAVSAIQLVPCEFLTRTRVGGAVDRRHEVSRKGFAEGTGRRL